MLYNKKYFFLSLIGLIGTVGSLQSFPMNSFEAEIYGRNQTRHEVQIIGDLTIKKGVFPVNVSLPPAGDYVTIHRFVNIGTGKYEIYIDKKKVAMVEIIYNYGNGLHDANIIDLTGTATNGGPVPGVGEKVVSGRDSAFCMHFPEFKIKVEPHLKYFLIGTQIFNIWIQAESAGC